MDTEHFLFYHDSEREQIKHIRAVSPDLHVAELFVTLVIETINLCYCSTFVIASDQVNSLGVFHFQSH